MKLKSISFFYKKITTAEQFNGVLSANHNPVKLLGISLLGFNPKFKVTQEIFESATKNTEAKGTLGNLPPYNNAKPKIGEVKGNLRTKKGEK